MGVPKRLAGPLALTNSAANVYNPASGVVARVRQIIVANKTNASHTYTFYLGATGASAAGTELFYQVTLAANTTTILYVDITMVAADFLTGLADANTAITVTVCGDNVVS